MSAHLDSWRHEKESAWLYGVVAAAEPDARKRRLFEQLGAAAEEQAAHWQKISRSVTPSKTRHPGESPSSRRKPGPSKKAFLLGPGFRRGDGLFKPSLRTRIVARLVRRFGPKPMRSVLAAMKLRGLSIYSAPPIAPGHPMPTSLEEVGARHRSTLGGNLRATVFGVNDGLVSNTSLVMGIAGAGAGNNYVLITGAAGLLAGALSMAAGEYVSVRSQREMYEHQIALERAELAEYPEEEAEELALIYQARGVEMDQARELTRALFANPEQALDVLAREELGLNPDALGAPWQAAGFSFVSFAAGAVLPLTPFLVGMAGRDAIVAAAALALLSLAAAGMALSLFTGRDAWRGALRMALIGGGAGIVSFWVGKALGAALH